MTIHLVTFSDESMERSRELCVASALQHGVNNAIQIVESKPCVERGCGYWKWKPKIILDVMTNSYQWEHKWAQEQQCKNDDIVIYADAGIEFINNVHYIVDRMDQDIFLFGNNWEHAHWCKRDAVEWVWPLHGRLGRDPIIVHERYSPSLTWNRFGKQVQASVIFFRVSDYSRAFVKEWLDWCLFEGGRLIDDSPSRTPNHPEFREHRHDQAILTCLSYREGLKLHWWPAVYNRFSGPEFIYEKGEYQDDYPPLFHHHRRRNDEWPNPVPSEPIQHHSLPPH